MVEEAWTELEWDAGKALWADFADRFCFRSGIDPSDWPAIVEPTPSVTWDLAPIFEGGDFASGARQVGQLVLDVLRRCTEWYEAVASHDWVHPSARFWPHRVDDVAEVPGWDAGGLFPDGDYTILVAWDYRFGIFGHRWEHSLCFWGQDAVEACERLNRGALTRILRQNGEPVGAPGG